MHIHVVYWSLGQSQASIERNSFISTLDLSWNLPLQVSLCEKANTCLVYHSTNTNKNKKKALQSAYYPFLAIAFIL